MFQVGEKVIHCSYGPGEILRVEEQEQNGKKAHFYVVQVGDLMLWVPTDNGKSCRLRYPTKAREFKSKLSILSSLAEPLSDDRLQRKSLLTERLQDGKIESILGVVRDIASFGHRKKLSESDLMLRERAERFLLEEWALSLETSTSAARQTLDKMLEDGWSIAQNASD